MDEFLAASSATMKSLLVPSMAQCTNDMAGQSVCDMNNTDENSTVSLLMKATTTTMVVNEDRFGVLFANQTSSIFSLAAISLPYVWTTLLEIAFYLCNKVRYMFYLVWPSETMFPSLDEVPRYVTEMFPIFFFMSIVENGIRILQGRHIIRVNESVGSLSQGIFQECLRIKVRSIEVLIYCLIYDNFRLITLPWQSLWTWWLCYISVDFGFYWAHRLAHEVNFIWAVHQAHHSSEEFSVVSALRQATLQPFTAWITYVPLALCIPPQIFLAHLQLSELFMAWLHTEIINNLGPLEYILNTPSHHRVHHSRNRNYIDKNYGGMLIIWDRMFGTFAKEDLQDPPVFGLVHPVQSFNPLYLQLHHWAVMYRRARSVDGIMNKIYVFTKGPGWRPGLKRLGNVEEIPEIVRPVNSYNPDLALWQSTYVIVHFAMVLLFYHELTMSKVIFSQSVITIGIIGLLTSITTLGFILDKKWFAPGVELTRCIIFIMTEDYLLPILEHGVKLYNADNYVSTILMTIRSIFQLSVAINLSHLMYNLVSQRHLILNKTVDIFNRGRLMSDKDDRGLDSHLILFPSLVRQIRRTKTVRQSG